MKPYRFQTRQKGGDPADGIRCNRGTKWQNHVADWWKRIGRAEAARRYREWLLNTPEGQALAAEARVELRGHPLGCDCRLDVPCHVDALLEAANS